MIRNSVSFIFGACLRRRLSALAVLISISICQAQPLRVLFIGNSYTYVNDLPGTLQLLAGSFGDSIIVDSYAPGGYTLDLHSTDANTLAHIASQQWDFVVLQEQSQLPSFDPAQVAVEVYPYAALLDSLIHVNDSCTETVFYMTWGRKNGDASNCPVYPPVCTYEGMQARLRESYLEMGLLNHATVSPVGAAWRYGRSLNPVFDFYQPDESHPSVYGTYLAACVFYATLFHKSPSGAPFTGSLSQQDAQWLQDVARTVVNDSLATWYQNGDIPLAAFTWNVNGLSVQFQQQSLNADSSVWTFGDGAVSTSISPVHVYGTPGIYTVTLQVWSGGCITDSVTESVNVGPSALEPDPEDCFKIGYQGTTIEIRGCKDFSGYASLYNMTGQLVRELRNPRPLRQFSMNVQGLEPGVYILRAGPIRRLVDIQLSY